MNLDVSVRTIMTGNVQVVQITDSLTDVQTLMLNGGFHHVPVLDGDTLVGILSAADLSAFVRALPDPLKETGVILSKHTVSDVMTKAVATVSIDAPIREAVLHFAEGGYHALPVMIGARVAGIFTTRDLSRHLLAD